MRRTKIVPVLWSLILLLSPSFWNALHADEPRLPAACDPEDPKSCIQPLFEGEKAPFTGQLMTNRRAAKLVVRAASCQERIDLTVQREQELWKIKLDLGIKLRANDTKAYEAKLAAMQKAMDAMKPKWYRHPAFVIPVTVVAVGLAAWGSIEAWDTLSKKMTSN